MLFPRSRRGMGTSASWRYQRQRERLPPAPTASWSRKGAKPRQSRFPFLQAFLEGMSSSGPPKFRKVVLLQPGRRAFGSAVPVTDPLGQLPAAPCAAPDLVLSAVPPAGLYAVGGQKVDKPGKLVCARSGAFRRDPTFRSRPYYARACLPWQCPVADRTRLPCWRSHPVGPAEVLGPAREALPPFHRVRSHH